MEQTAVEWFEAHVNRVIDLHKRKLISEDKFRSLLIEYRKQAKAMEKQQKMDFANWCRIHDNKYPNTVMTIQQLYDKYEQEINNL